MNPSYIQKLQRARQFIQNRKHAEGLALYAQLFKESPECGGEYGRAAAHCGDFELAAQVWEKLRKLEPNNASYIFWLAGEYAKIGLNGKARILLSRAATIEPRNLEARIRLAWLLTRTGSVDEGRAAVNECLALDARNQPARYLAACLERRENKLAAAEQQLRSLLAEKIDAPNVRYSCHCELANILDKTERFDEAMAQLAEAKSELRQVLTAESEGKNIFEPREKEISEVRALPKNILTTWVQSFEPATRAATPPLVFLTGSARSGTTLLERILDAHPSVAAADEPYAFFKIQPFVDINAPVIPSPELNVWRQRYVKNMTVELGVVGRDKMLLDKNPSHTFWLPSFLRVFPEMRVLIALRDPRDIMMSLYFQDQPFSNPLTLEELARHYSDVMEMWLAVREWEGLAWMETRYEDIVADLQKEGRRVTEFLGLQWHENQTRYHEKNREKPILSTNYSDVSKPVYTKSVGRWRAYEKFLAPVLPALETYCKKFRYA